jgi:hypothetical protein
MSKLINQIRQEMYVQRKVDALSILLRRSYQIIFGGGMQFHFFPLLCMCVCARARVRTLRARVRVRACM